MCDLLEVSQSGYYDSIDRPSSNRQTKHSRILKEIRRIHKKHPVWGVDPIWAEVKETIPCSRNTVYSIMKINGIKSKHKAKWKATTNSNHNLAVAPNLLEQNFSINTPNTAWVGDITYHWTEEG